MQKSYILVDKTIRTQISQKSYAIILVKLSLQTVHKTFVYSKKKKKKGLLKSDGCSQKEKAANILKYQMSCRTTYSWEMLQVFLRQYWSP